jgi:3-oxoacyl-[acyl-carrier protein] reductase
MNLGLEQKSVLVTGSSRGIGLTVAELFLEEGASVAITGRDPDVLGRARVKLGERFGEDRVTASEGDLTSGEDPIRTCIEKVVDRFGKLDILVCSVGSGSGVAGLEADAAEWDRLLHLNLMGAVYAVRQAVPLMERSGGGSIVLISSIAGLDAGPAPLAYSAAKASLLSLGQNLGRQLADQGIRVNVVSPGNVLHPGSGWEKKLEANHASTMSYIESAVPMGRFGTPREIANAVVFLASERTAGFVTGANLVVDGGQTCRI